MERYLAMAVGISALLDFSGVFAPEFHLASTWEQLLDEALIVGKMTKISISSHQFKKIKNEDTIDSVHENLGGSTAFALLAESHISVHTWPELGKVVVDVFACGSADNLSALIEFIVMQIEHTNLNVTHVRRGDNPE